MTNEHFTIVSILALSIIIQLAAAIMAFRLIAITGRRSAWSLIALALMLMAVRRVVPLYRLMTGNLTLPPDLLNEVIGLVLSVVMAAGIARIAPLFIERKRAEDALHERVRHSQSLLRLSRNLERAQTYTEVLNAARDEVKTVIGYQNLWAYLLTEDRKYAHVLMASESLEKIVMSDEGVATLTIQGDRMLEEIAEAREIVVVEDARTDERTDKEIVARLGNRTIVNIPIILFDRHLGSIGTGTFGDEGVRPPVNSEREYLIALASHMAVALDRIHLLVERKRAEKALQIASEYNRSLIEASLDPLVTIGPDGKITDVNDATVQVTGVRRENIIGSDFSDYFTEPGKASAGYQLVLSQGLVRDYPLTIRHQLGKTTDVLYNAVIYKNTEGKVEGVFAAARDITDLKRAEEKTRLLSAIVQSSDDAIISKSLDGTILSWNKGAEKIYGYTEQEAIGNPISILVSPEREDEIPQILKRIASGEHIEHFETIRRRKDGQDIFVSLAISPIWDADGRIVAASTIARDITGRKRAEEALRRTNILLEQIFAATEFMVAYLDADFNFIRVNRAYAESAEGCDPKFFEGKNHFALYPNSENEEIFQKVVETGEPYTAYAKPFEYAGHPERGITYWNWSLQPVRDENGRVSGLVFSLIDVTGRERAYVALRQREEQLRLQGAALEAAANGFMITDRSGKIIWVNPAFSHLTGYSMQEAIGRNPNMCKSENQDREFYKNLWDTILSGKIWHGELVNRRKDGHHYTEEMTIAPLRGEQGEISHFIAVKQDVTERKLHEREREAIIKVSTALRRAATRNEILNVIMDQLVGLFKADGAVLVSRDPQTGGFIDEMGRGPVGEKMIGLNIPPGKGVCNWVVTNKKPYLTNRADRDPLFYRPDLLGDSNCLASVPLIAQEQAIGALWIARRENLAEQDLRLLNAIADIAANAIHRVVLHEQTEQQLNHLTALHQIDLAISANFDSNITLNVILSNVKAELGVDAACILLLGPVTTTFDYAAGIGFRTRGIEGSHVGLGDGCSGRAAQENRTASCPDLKLARATFGRFSLLAEEEFVAHYATPLAVKGQVKGVLELFHRKPLEPGKEWLNYFETLATQAAIAIESASLFENLQRSNKELTLAYDATIEGWSRALDLRDKETEGHTQRVTEMALILAGKIGMSDAEKLDLRRGALLHDIGKMGVPDSILHKPGLLTESEWTVMREHPSYAYQMLSPITYLKHALDISYCHHEKWDGSGYPRGLKGEEIPLTARVFAVVDVFDALTSDRPYRAAWPRADAYRYIQEQAGLHFDPQVVKIFLETRLD